MVVQTNSWTSAFITLTAISPIIREDGAIVAYRRVVVNHPGQITTISPFGVHSLKGPRVLGCSPYKT